MTVQYYGYALSAQKKVGMYSVVAGSLLLGALHAKHTLIYYQALIEAINFQSHYTHHASIATYIRITLLKIIIIIALVFIELKQAYGQNLVETYQLALINNPTLNKAYFEKFTAAESRSQSIAKMLPTVSVTGKSSKERLDNSRRGNVQGTGLQNYYDHSLNIDFKQPVFHWDHWIQLSQSDNKIAQAEANYLAEQQSLMAKTTEAYFNILSAQDELESALAEKKAIQRQLEVVQQRFTIGLVAITDVHNAQAELDQANANEIDTENKLYESKEELIKITGGNNINLNPIEKELLFTPPVPEDISAWSEAAENNNYNIVAALNEAEASRKSIDLQRSGHLPQLDIIANYALKDANSRAGFQGDTQSIGLELNMPIFEGGAVNSRTREAQYEFNIAQEKAIETRRSVNQEVKNAYRGVVSSLNRVGALKKTIISIENALATTEAGFRAGTLTMADVLTVQRKLYRTDREYSRSRYDYLIHGINLKYAGGSLTEDDLEQINRFLEKH